MKDDRIDEHGISSIIVDAAEAFLMSLVLIGSILMAVALIVSLAKWL